MANLDPDVAYRQGEIDDQERHLLSALTNEAQAFLDNVSNSPFDIREAIEGYQELGEKLSELAEYMKVTPSCPECGSDDTNGFVHVSGWRCNDCGYYFQDDRREGDRNG